MDVSMVFGLIFTCIVISAILIFGWEQITNFFGIGSQAQLAKTAENLKKNVDSVYGLAEGSGAEFRLALPKEYRLCFFNSSNPAARFYASRANSWDPDTTTKYRINASGYNTWYFSGDGVTIPHLDMPTNKNFCAPGGSDVYIVKRFEGVEIEMT
jgi:hypothetical protein